MHIKLSAKQKMHIQTWLGLLVLGIVLGIAFKVPNWIADVIIFLFISTILILLVLSLVIFLLKSIPPLRRVRFWEKRIQKDVPFRPRVLKSLSGERHRYRRHKSRKDSLEVKLLQRGFELLSILFTLSVFIILYLVVIHIKNPKWLSIIMFFAVPSICFYFGWKSLKLSQVYQRRHKQLTAASARDAIEQDERKLIVLLRSFSHDGREAELLIEKDVAITLEEFFVGQLSKHGPVVAIGRPGETLPPLGAYREYVATDWESRVIELLDHSQCILAIIDNTPGLMWEIETVFKRSLHHRLILILPESTSTLKQSWKLVIEVISRYISDLPKNTSTAPVKNALVCVFDKNCHPHWIVGPGHTAEYYCDAVTLASWYVFNT